jgi:enoyl-CoA hydratase/carnithine racemase
MPVTLHVDPNGVGTLLLDRPAKRNALDRAMLESLGAAIVQLGGRDDLRAVVVRGAGGTFCAGADIADWVGTPGPVAAGLSRLGRDAFAALAALPVPSLAVIEGGAFGGGLELALACDLRVAADDAILGLPETRLGNLPSWGGIARLAAVAGLGVARQLILGGEMISGARAAGLLVVGAAAPAAELEALVRTTVERLLAADSIALALAKQVLDGYALDHPLEPALAAYTAGLDSSRRRKQDFLDQRARRRRVEPV